MVSKFNSLPLKSVIIKCYMTVESSCLLPQCNVIFRAHKFHPDRQCIHSVQAPERQPPLRDVGMHFQEAILVHSLRHAHATILSTNQLLLSRLHIRLDLMLLTKPCSARRLLLDINKWNSSMHLCERILLLCRFRFRCRFRCQCQCRSQLQCSWLQQSLELCSCPLSHLKWDPKRTRSRLSLTVLATATTTIDLTI
jgi:hypothetical protein